MTFKNALIPEEVKDTFTFPVQINNSGKKQTLWKWTVDEERGMYLVLAATSGGAYSGTRQINTYYFHVHGEDLLIKATPWGGGAKGDKCIFTWKIIELNIPSRLRDKSGEIVSLIKEAFSVLGHLYDGENYDLVTIDFLCDTNHMVNSRSEI